MLCGRKGAPCITHDEGRASSEDMAPYPYLSYHTIPYHTTKHRIILYHLGEVGHERGDVELRETVEDGVDA